MKFTFSQQHDASDCGAACLKMVVEYYGRKVELQQLRELCYVNKDGVTMLGISDAAEIVGFRTMGVKIDLHKLLKKMVLPCIIHWRQSHFVVVYDINVKKRAGKYIGKISIADPAFGKINYSVNEFMEGWISAKNNGIEKGMVLMLVPTNRFYLDDTYESQTSIKQKIRHFVNYLKPHKGSLIQIFIGMLAGTVLQLIFPFLSQSLIDVGIQNNNINFVILILISQLILSVIQMIMNFIRGWISLHISARISVALRADFLAKLFILPMQYFDSKRTGDILQRMDDHSRIQGFITDSSLGTPFMILNFFVFAFILGYYNITLLFIFLLGHGLLVCWILLFMGIRRRLDFKAYDRRARNQSTMIQLVTGAPEIKLNNCERKMRWKWENLQAELFEIRIQGLSYSQVQRSGSFFLSHTTNIILTVITAKAVIEGKMTLGMMLALSYILGQLKGPINGLVGFLHSYQDAKISLERLNEVHFSKDEDQANLTRISDITNRGKCIDIKDLSFSYLGPSMPPVLNKINLKIPENKITAIVGASGSGKTTLLKLLLGNYTSDEGTIEIGDINIKNINTRAWRARCGVVMQEGYIFSETIAENIALVDEVIDKEKLYYAARVANIHEFIEQLPGAYNTKIGQEGSGLSKGQKQRILIARAIYKKPDFIFFDEATNSLDANNEKIIIENLSEFFRGRTVVIVAHRLSTVKNADNIIVMDKGKIVEGGTHDELVKKRGEYYTLVKNQLELGN